MLGSLASFLWNVRCILTPFPHVFKVEDRVAGLSTAAGIWIVAAIGFGVANGYWYIGLLVTALVLVVQFGMLFFLSPHFWQDLREKYTLHQLDDPIETDGTADEERRVSTRISDQEGQVRADASLASETEPVYRRRKE